MKTFLIYIAFILFSVQVFAQISPVQTIRVVNLTTAFGSPVPFETHIEVASDSTEWKVVSIDGLTGTETITSALATNPRPIDPVPSKIKGSTQINVTGPNGHLVLTVPDGTITNVKLANMATKTFKGRTSTGTGVPEDLSVSTVKTDLSLNNIDNTSDANKPVSTAGQIALDLKRSISNHDSLSTLQEKNYSSLDGKPNITLFRLNSDHDSLSTLQEKNYSSLDGKPDLTVYLESADISGKVDKVAGKVLSDNNFTDADSTKLLGIAAGATVESTFGTVTSVEAGTGITGGTITTTGTLAIDTTVVAKKTTVAAMYLPKRTFGDAANSATGDFIQNQNAAAQSANMWINGSIKANGVINTLSVYLSNGLYTLYRDTSDTRLYGGTNGITFADAGNSISTFTIDNDGNATLYGGINSPTYKLSGNDLFGSLSTNYVPLWDGSKFVNSSLYSYDSNTLYHGGLRFSYSGYDTNIFYSGGSGGFNINNQENSAGLFYLSNTGNADFGYGGTHSEKFAVNGNVYIASTTTSSGYIIPGKTSADYVLADGTTTNVSGAVYKGQVNGSTGSGLADGTGTVGWYYACSTAGTYDYGSGNITLAIGDQLYYNGTIWLKIPGAGSYTLPVGGAVLGGVKSSASVSIDGSGVASVSTAYDASGTTATHAALTITAHGLGASAFHADSYFLTPTGSAASLTSFPTLNQNTTGNAATATNSTNFNGQSSGDFMRMLGGVTNNVNANILLTGFYINTTGNGTGNTNFIHPYGTIATFDAGYFKMQQSMNEEGELQYRAYNAGTYGSWRKSWDSSNLNLSTVPFTASTITATTFIGALTGNATTATNLTGLTTSVATLNNLTSNLAAKLDTTKATSVLRGQWNTAYTDRNKWDGGSTGLTATTGRTSLGGTTIGQAVFTSTNPGAITFGRANANNTFDWLSAADFRTAIGAGSGGGDMLLSGVQSVTGAKTFDKDKILIKGTSSGVTTLSTANTSATNYTVTFPATTGMVALTSQITGTNSGTNTGDVNFKTDHFSEYATGAIGEYHILTHTPENTSTGIQVIYNGTPIETTQFQYSAGTVRVLGQVYANDKVAISYLYK